MAQKSSIEWTDMTWNPVRGCALSKTRSDVVSESAYALNHTLRRHYCFCWFWFLHSARSRRSSSSVGERCGPAGRSSVRSARTSLLNPIRSEPECVGLPVTVTRSPDLMESAVQPRFERFSLPTKLGSQPRTDSGNVGHRRCLAGRRTNPALEYRRRVMLDAA